MPTFEYSTTIVRNMDSFHMIVKILKKKTNLEKKQKIIFLELSNSARKLVKFFWPQSCWTRSLPGPNFLKPSVPGDLRVFRAFASLLFILLWHKFWMQNLHPKTLNNTQRIHLKVKYAVPQVQSGKNYSWKNFYTDTVCAVVSVTNIRYVSMAQFA